MSSSPRRVLTVLATVLVTGFLAAPTANALPIPPGFGDPFVPRYLGTPAATDPVPAVDVPEHPFLAANGSSNMHNDAYATDAYTGDGPRGRHLEVTSATYGIQECATQTFDRAGRIVALCGGLFDRQLKLIDPQTLDVLAVHNLPRPAVRPGQSPLTDVCGGAYFYLDNEDRAIVATTNRQIRVFDHSSSRFTEQRRYDLAGAIPEDDCLLALNPDWSGRIWFVTGHGGVGTVDPAGGNVSITWLRDRHGTQETIANSFAVDETGGVFVLSDHALYRFDAGPANEPILGWRKPYDRGSTTKPGQLSQGSGTTPTLLGDDLVAITDNADPQMHLLVYPRGEDAAGNSVIVENNYGYTGPGATLLGNTTAPGIEKVDIHDSGCSIAWHSAETAPTSVPKVSLANGLLYVYTKPPNDHGIAAWYFTALDLRTGRTIYKRLTGTGAQWNNHYASIYLGPDGTAYLACMSGMIRIRDGSDKGV